MNQINWIDASAWVLNSSGGSGLTLTSNGSNQAKVESLGLGGVTINAPITFAATTGPAWGEINATASNITFGSAGTLTVNGSQVAGIRLGGALGATTFNNTVSASGKYFATTTIGQTVNIGGSFTSDNFYLMNSGTLNVQSAATFNASGLRLGGDSGTTGLLNQTLGATFNLTSGTGGQTYAGIISTMDGNTSGALVVNSQNTSGTNTLSGHISLDSNLKISASGAAGSGTLAVTQARSGVSTNTGTDIKNQTLTLDATNTGNAITYSGDIYNSTGTGNVTKIGAGLVTISGKLNIGGNLTVNAGGTLNLTGTGDTARQVTLTAGSTLDIGASGLALDNAGSDTVTVGTAGTINATGGGTLKLNGGTSTNGGDFGSNIANGILTVNAVIANGTQSHMDIFGNVGSHTVILTAANTLTGNTNIIQGTLRLANSSALQNSTVRFAGFDGYTALTFASSVGSNAFTIGALESSVSNGSNANFALQNTAGSPAAVALTVGGNNASTTYSGIISGAGSLIKTGTGTMTFTNTASTYAGGTTISGGTLALGADGTNNENGAALGTGQVTVSSGGTLRLGGSTGAVVSYNIANAVTLDNGNIFSNDGAQHLQGALTVNSGGGSIGAQYSGKDVFIDGLASGSGTLSLNNTGGSLVQFTNTSATNSLGGLAGSGGATLASGVALSVGSNGSNTAFSGALSGAGRLVKTGAGTLTLTGNNVQTGVTSVAGGTLQLSSSGTLANTSAVSVTSGTLLLAGSAEKVNDAAGLTLNAGTLGFANTVTGSTETLLSLTLTGNSTLDFGTAAGAANKFAFTNGIFGLATYTLTVNHWTGPLGSGAQDILAYGGTNLTSAMLANISFYNDANVFVGTGQEVSFGGPAFQTVPVPEPATLFGALALTGLVGWRERRRFAGWLPGRQAAL